MEEPNHGTRKTNEVEEIWSGGEKGRRGSEEPCSHHNEEGYKDAGGTSNKGAAARPPGIHPGTTDHR